MIPPVVVAMAAGAFLVFDAGLTRQGLLLGLILSPFYFLGAEILSRRIALDSQGITISKFLRSVRLEWSAVESVDAVKTGAKLFLILQGRQERPVFVTNSIRYFGELKDAILARVPEERIASGVREMLDNPPTKHGPMMQAWIVCLVLTGMAVARILGYG